MLRIMLLSTHANKETEYKASYEMTAKKTAMQATMQARTPDAKSAAKLTAEETVMQVATQTGSSSEKQRATQTAGLNKGLLALAAIVCAFALLQTGIWTARRDISLDGSLLYLVRFSQVAVYFIVAYLFRNHIPSVKRVLAFAAAAFGLHLFLEGLLLVAVSATMAPTFSLLSHVFSGIANASVLLLVAHVFSSYSPKLSTVAIAVAFLLAEMLFTLTAFVPQSVINEVQFSLKLLGFCLVFVSVYWKSACTLDDDQHPLQYGLSYDRGCREQPLKFLTNTADWVFQVITAALIPFIFGFMSQLVSTANTSIGLHDATDGFCAAFVLATLVVFCLIRKSRIGFNDLFVPVILLYATGLCTLPMLWDANSPFAGSLLTCGMQFYHAVLWILLARKSFEGPRHTYLYFGVFLGFANVFYGRFAEPFLLGAMPCNATVLSNVTLVFMWLLIVLCLVLFVLQRTTYAQGTRISGATKSTNDQAFAEQVSVNGTNSEGLSNGDPFVAGIDMLTEQCNLTRREREVLIEIMHGYSMPNVAKKLYISPETVRTHMKNIYRKTDTSNKQSLIHLIDSLGKGNKS